MGDCGPWACMMAYGWILYGLYLTTAIVSQTTTGGTDRIMYTRGITSSIANQVSTDWNRQPYVDVKVFNNTERERGCPPDYPETVMLRQFYGSNFGCDCLDVFSYWITDEDTMIHGKECTYNQTTYGCLQAYASPAIILDTFRGRSICGKTGGVPFLLVERPDKQTGKCKEGFEPCSKFTSPDNTICYDKNMDPDEVCPVTKFDFSVSADSNNLGLAQDASFKTEKFEDGVYLHYTKDADSLPASSIKVESQVCTDPQYQVQAAAHELELQSSFFCDVEPHTRTQQSEIYTKVGDAFVTNEFDVQYENMAGMFIESIPGYNQYYGNPQAEKDHILSPWSRPTFPWSLECEDFMTRQQADELIYSQMFSTHHPGNHGIQGPCLGIYIAGGLCSFVGFCFFGLCIGLEGSYDEALFVVGIGHLANRIIMYVIAPILLVRLGRIQDFADSAILGFNTLAEHQNECGHPQTRIDLKTAEVEIKRNGVSAKAALTFVWIVIVQLCVELAALLCFPIFLAWKENDFQDNFEGIIFDFVPFVRMYKTLN